MASEFSLSNNSIHTKRALLIGNNEYKKNSQLRYCINDAEDLAKKLHNINFEITVGANLTYEEMDRIIEAFNDKINPGDLVIFFFSGHGYQWSHLNFLIPIDEDRITTNTDLKYRAINAQAILEKIMGRRPSASIFLLNCSRNSFVCESSNSNDLSSIRAVPNSFIGFAYDTNKVALDESINDRNSLFTYHLLQHIDQPNLTIDEIMYDVCDGVMKETNDDQCPFRVSSLRRRVYLNQQFTTNEPDKIHIALHSGYSIKKTREFIVKYAPYLRTTLKIAQVIFKRGNFVIPQLDSASESVDSGIYTILPTPDKQKEMEQQLNLVEKLLDRVDHQWTQSKSTMFRQDKLCGVPLQGLDLREVEKYLDVADNKRSLGNLCRTVTVDGHVRWVCLEHYDDISFNNAMFKYIEQLEAMGGKFDMKTREAVVSPKDLSSKSVQILCEALTKGFNVLKLTFKGCTVKEDDLVRLLDVVINRSSIQCLNIFAVCVYNLFGNTKYVCKCMTTEFNNQSFQVRFYDSYQDGHISMLTQLLLQNRIHRTLDFSASDFMDHERDLQQCFETKGIVTGLIVNHSNNVDIINALFNSKMKTLYQLKFNSSLHVPSTLSLFCGMLKTNQTLVEMDIMDQLGINDEAFIVNLLNSLKGHKSIKQLSLHVKNIERSDRKEASLIESLKNDQFISHLRLSESVITHKLTQAFIQASQECHTLRHLELYHTQVNIDDVQQLKSLYENHNLMYLKISEQSCRYAMLEETNEQPAKEQSSLVNHININTKWKQHGITVAGGNGYGKQLNQLSLPWGIYVDDDHQTIHIADCFNHRIVEWKCEAKNGQVVAGKIGEGNRSDQLNQPRDVIVDEKNDSIIICDSGNRRVVRWSRQNGTNGETIISDIDCCGLTMDKNGDLYVSDCVKNEVKRWKQGERKGTIVAGGNGQGNHLNQLHYPIYIFVDEDHSVYVSDFENHRVMKWMKGAKEGIVVAGGNGHGNSLTQLSYPLGVIVDHFGSVYVADRYNDRIMRWCEGSCEGSIVVGGNGKGNEPNQFNGPIGLSFDTQGNLYVVDGGNDRIQKVDIDSIFNLYEDRGKLASHMSDYDMSIQWRQKSLVAKEQNQLTTNSNIGEANNSTALVEQSPTYKFQYSNRPIVYIVDLELPSPSIEWDLEIAQLEKHNMHSQLADVIRELNPTIPFYILASKPPSDETMLHAQLLRYYYLRTSSNEPPQTDLNVDDRVISIDSIDHFASELYENLGQYYRDEAEKVLFKHQDRDEAKQLLTKSKKCFEILERDIEKTLKHYKNLAMT